MSIDMQELTREILRSGSERAAFLAELPTVTHTQLQQLTIARERMSHEQRARRAGERAQLARATATWLHDLTTRRHERTQRERASLLRAERARRGEAAAHAQATARLLAQRHAEIGATLREMSTDRAQEQREWNVMIAKLGRRGEGRARAARGRRASPPRAAADPGRAPVAGASESSPLAERIYEHLAGRADGARLVDLSERFNVARIRLAGVLKKLIDEGRVEKRDLRYLARGA